MIHYFRPVIKLIMALLFNVFLLNFFLYSQIQSLNADQYNDNRNKLEIAIVLQEPADFDFGESSVNKYSLIFISFSRYQCHWMQPYQFIGITGMTENLQF